MVVNFRARWINQGAHKLTRTPMLIKKQNYMIISLSKRSRRTETAAPCLNNLA